MEQPQKFKKTDLARMVTQGDENIEALRLTKENLEIALLWSGGFEVEEIDALDHNLKFVGMNIMTEIGPRRCSEGDYLARNEQGRLFVLKAVDFEFAYEPV